MKMFTKTVMVAAALLGASAASAQTFTGPRVEARVGFDSLELNVPKSSAKAEGVTYGIGVGYDLALAPHVIVGVEAAIDNSSTDKTFAGNLKADARRDIEVGARLGYAVSDSTLLYVKGAYSNARVGASLKGKSLGTSVGEGYRVGGGAEFALTRHLYAKAEYRFTDYGDDVKRHQGLVGIGVRL